MTSFVKARTGSYPCRPGNSCFVGPSMQSTLFKDISLNSRLRRSERGFLGDGAERRPRRPLFGAAFRGLHSVLVGMLSFESLWWALLPRGTPMLLGGRGRHRAGGGGVALLHASEHLKGLRTRNDDQKTGVESCSRAPCPWRGRPCRDVRPRNDVPWQRFRGVRQPCCVLRLRWKSSLVASSQPAQTRRLRKRSSDRTAKDDIKLSFGVTFRSSV